MLNIAVVGAGLMGQLHAQAISHSDVANLAAIVDIDETAGPKIAEQFGTTYHRSTTDALGDSGIDAYVVALPDRLHGDASIEILEAGKPLLVEKPMAHELAVAKNMVAAAERGGARLLVGQILRHDPRYIAAAEAVRAGRIGEPLHVTAGRIATQDLGVRLNGTTSVAFYAGIHDVDAVQWVTGLSITRVYARKVAKLMPSLGIEGEEAIFALVDLSNGGIGQLYDGWSRADATPAALDGRLELYGTHGHVEVDMREGGVKIFGKDQFDQPDTMVWPTVNGRIWGALAAEISHFVDAVVNDSPFVVEVEEAVRAVAVNDAILRSLESGNPEDVELI